MAGDRWATATFDALGEVVRAFESIYARTVFEQPGRVSQLPDALGGDAKRWPLLAAPAKGKAGFFELLERKAHFLVLPKPIVAVMKTPRVFLSEKPVPAGFAGEMDGQNLPRTAEIRIPGASDALASAGSDLGRVGAAPAPNTQYDVLRTTYHEMTHAWLWLQEFYDAELGDLYRAGLAAYDDPRGVNGTRFRPHDAFTEAAAYYVGDRVQRWCTALRSLDRLLRAPPADPLDLQTYLQSIVDVYGGVSTDAWVRLNGDALEKIASPALSAELRAAIDEHLLDGLPLTRPLAETPLAGLRDALLR